MSKEIVLSDYWNNGNIDVMVGDVLVGEVSKNGRRYEFTASVKVALSSKQELEEWVSKNSNFLFQLSQFD